MNTNSSASTTRTLNDREKLAEIPCKELFAQISHGSQEAFSFLCLWHRYCHAIDDIVDGDMHEPGLIIESFYAANVLYTCPFYRDHLELLNSQVILMTHLYAISVRWEQSAEQWRKEYADVLRNGYNAMLILVAHICNPNFAEVNRLAEKCFELSYLIHHDKEGNAI